MAALDDLQEDTGTEPFKLAPLEENPFEESEASKKRRGAMAIVGNTDSNPDDAGKAIALGRKLKVDPALVDFDLPAWEKDAKTSENVAIVHGNKAIRDYLISDPMAAKVSHDDLGVLDKITKKIAAAWAWKDNIDLSEMFIPSAKADELDQFYTESKDDVPKSSNNYSVPWSEAAHYGALSTRLGLLGAKLSGATPEEAAILRPQITQIQNELASRPESNGTVNYLKNLIGGFAGQVGESWDKMLVEGTAGAVTFGTIGALGTGPAAPLATPLGVGLGYGVGFSHAFATVSAQVATGNAYLKLENVEGLSQGQKQTAALGIGLTVGVIQSIGGKMATDAVGQIVENIVSTATGKAALGTFLTEVAKSQVEWGALGVAQTFAEKLGEDITKSAGTESLDTIFNSTEKRVEFAKEVGQSFVDSVVMGTMLAVPMNLRGRGTRTGDHIAAAKAQGMQLKLDDLMLDAQESLTKGRSPEQFANVLARQNPDPILSLDAATVLENRKNLQFIPDIDVQLANAQKLGTEIKVRQSQLVAYLDPKVYEGMRDGIRFGSEALNPAEALKIQQAEIARQQQEQKIKEDLEKEPVPPKEEIPDTDIITAIWGDEAGKAAKAETQVPPTLQLGEHKVDLPPEAQASAQSLIDRFLGRRQVPTTEQFDAYIQAQNLKNLLRIKRKTPLQQAQISPTPEALPVAAEAISETTGRPQTQDASTFLPAPNADTAVNLMAEIGKAETTTLIDHLRTLMEQTVPDNVDEAVLARALSRNPRNKAQLHTFIDEEAKLTKIQDPKSIHDQADAALAALGTRLLKEHTPAVVNGLSDIDAQRAARVTAQSIDQARYVMGFTPLFEVGEGMTAAERAVYEQHVQDVQAGMTESVFASAREVTEIKEGKRWQDQKEKMRPDVEDSVAQTPAIVADEYFRTGHARALADEVHGLQMTRRDVDSLFTSEELKAMGIKSRLLSNNVLFKGQKWAKEDSPNAASSDMFAQAFGYQTGLDMVLDLLQYRDSLKQTKESPAQRFDRLVEEELNRRMVEQNGNFDKIVENNTIAAAWNIAEERVLKNELDALSGLSGSDLIKLPDMRKLVDDSMREMTNDEAIDSKTYQYNAGRHGRLAKEAKDAGDYATALNEKRLQLQSAMMAKWGQDHKKVVAANQRLTNKLTGTARVKDLDPEVNTRMLQLIALSGLDPGKRGVQVLANDIAALKESNLATWIQERNRKTNADTIPIPTYIDQLPVPIKSVGEMKVDNFNEFNDTLRALEFVGKKDNLVGLQGQEVKLDESMATLQAQVADLVEKRGYEKFGDIVQPERGISAKRRGAVGNLLRAETVTMKADRLKDDGILHKILISPLKAAQKWYADMEILVNKAMQKIDHGEWAGAKGARVDTLWRTVPNDSIMAPNGKPREFRRDEMLMIALRWGDAESKQLMSHTLNTDQTTIDSWLHKNMTEKNWDFVQNIWDMYKDHIDPERDGVYRRTRGFGMEYPDAEGFTDAFGKNRRGGTIPLMKHREGTIEGQAANEVGLVDTRVWDPLPSNSMRQSTKALRNGEDIKLTLNFDELPHRIREDLHELTYREAVQNAAKIVNDPRFYQAIHDSFGKAQADIFKPWIQGIASNGGHADMQTARTIGWLFNKIQSNAVTNVIGFNPGTALVHSPTAMMNTIGEAGLYTFRALRKTFGDSKLTDLWGRMSRSKESWDEMTGFALEHSAELATRIRDKNRDMAYSLGQWGNWEALQNNSERWGQAHIAYTDYGTAVMAWWAGYERAIDEGKTHEEAVQLGDRTIRLAHNSANLMDKSQFTNDRALKGFAQFYGFFNHVFNQLHVKGFAVGESIREAKKAYGEGELAEADFKKMGAAMGSAAWTSFSGAVFYVGALAFIHNQVRGQEEKALSWGANAAKEVFGTLASTVPIAREITYAALHGEYAKASTLMTTALDVPRRWIRDMKKWATKVDPDKPMSFLPPMQTTSELVGTFGGVKFATKQVGRWLEEMQRIQRGETKPPLTFTEWRRLYVYGRSNPVGFGKGHSAPPGKWYPK